MASDAGTDAAATITARAIRKLVSAHVRPDGQVRAVTEVSRIQRLLVLLGASINSNL